MPTPPQRLVFFGSPEMSASHLEALCDAGFDVALAVTNPPARRSRRAQPAPTPVAEAAASRGIDVAHHPDAALDAGSDLGVVVAYGRLIRASILAALPMVNLHFSLLPRWRGAAPIERAILAGDTETGVCLMQLEETLDTGAIHACLKVPIDASATLSELRRDLTSLSCALLVGSLRDGLGEPRPQQGEVTWAQKLTPEDVRLDWRLPTQQLHRRVRLERAWTTVGGKRLLVPRAEPADNSPALDPGEMSGELVGTSDGALRLLEVKPEGRRSMSAKEWLRGARASDGDFLGT